MRATRLGVANYNTTLSSDSLESGTGSSNSLRSPIQSLSFRTSRRIDRNSRVCARFANGLLKAEANFVV
jgi:hypothetical protein